MAPRPALTRRRFLGGAAVLLAAGAPTLGRLALGRPLGAPQDALALRLASLVDGDDVRALGRAHLVTMPADATAASVARDLLPASLSPERALRMPIGELREAVAAAVEADFRKGHVTPVAGWLLSATEARLCVLHVLT